MATGYDAHCHLDFAAFDADREQVLERSRQAGITRWAIAGADPRWWDRVEVVGRSIGASVALGVHPWWASDMGEVELDRWIQELCEREIDAVGETGLDAFRARDADSLDKQERSLRRHLAVARDRGLPVVLHCVRAAARLLRVIERDGSPGRGGLIHGFTGPAELVPWAVELGLHLSFGTRVLTSRRAQAAVVAVPSHRLLLETDCPDQPIDGEQRGEPAHLLVIAREVARLRGVGVDALLRSTTANACALW